MTRPYYDEGGITIYHGDCREILPELGAFDLELTDPPYGTGYQYQSRHRTGRGGPKRWSGNSFGAIDGDAEPFDPSHLLGVAPAIILWGANHYASKLPDNALWFVWDRKAGRAPDTNITDAELAWVSGHRFKTVRMFRHMWAGLQRDSEIAEGSLHPTQKPVALMSWCLGFFPDARTVVDPYMGSGPVARACKDAGRRYVGIELVERYCEIAVRRLAQEVLFA